MCPINGSTARVVCELLYTAALITKPTSEELILAKKKRKKKPDSRVETSEKNDATSAT